VARHDTSAYDERQSWHLHRRDRPASIRNARRPDRSGTAAVRAVVHLPATAVEEGRGPTSISGILADSTCRLLPVW